MKRALCSTVEEFRREVRDKLFVALACGDASPLRRSILMRQCEDFLVDEYAAALRIPEPSDR